MIFELKSDELQASVAALAKSTEGIRRNVGGVVEEIRMQNDDFSLILSGMHDINRQLEEIVKNLVPLAKFYGKMAETVSQMALDVKERRARAKAEQAAKPTEKPAEQVVEKTLFVAPKKKYTPEEDELLRKLAAKGNTAAEIAKVLKRTKKSVQSRAYDHLHISFRQTKK